MISVTDIAVMICRPDVPVRDMLERLNACEYRFQIIVDDARRVLGTVTDGDVRRALLRGIRLEDEAQRCMGQHALIGETGKEAENRRKLAQVPRQPAFLPIVDNSGVLHSVLVATQQSDGLRHALVLAGGLGSRLGEHTRTTPKPLLRVGDRPILDHILERLEETGVDTIHISVNYLAGQIEEFVSNRPNKARISFVRENQRLGTAGPLANLRPRPERPILVLNGDVLTKTDFRALESFHRQHNYDVTIAVAQHELHIPYGVVRCDPSGAFSGIAEKPVITNFVAAGIYYLPPDLVALVPENRPMDMPELLDRANRLGMTIGLFPIHEYWRDIGRPDDLLAAEREIGPAK